MKQMQKKSRIAIKNAPSKKVSDKITARNARGKKSLGKKTLGIVTIVNDADIYFLPEWLHFHRLAGVQMFYLMARCKGLDKVIKKIPFANDIVITDMKPSDVDVCRNYTDIIAYRYLMQQYKDNVEWMILADVNDFFFSTNGSRANDDNLGGENLCDVLANYEQYDCGGVIVPRKAMGLSGYIDKPPLPITDHLILADRPAFYSQYEVIVRTDAYTGCHNGWFFDVSKPYVNQDGTDFDGYGYAVTHTPIKPQRILCHNYFARGVEDIIAHAWLLQKDGKNDGKFEGVFQRSYDADMPNTDATLYSQELKLALKIKGANATPENTIFVSVADYANPENVTKMFNQSAEEYGVEIRWASWGGGWESFMQNKVRNVLVFLKAMRSEGKKYAFVLDCADVIFTQSLNYILNTFNRIYDGGVLFNCDYCDVMWPLEDNALKWYINSNYGKNGMLNAGCYCGAISDIIALLEELLEVREQIKNKNYQWLCTQLFAASVSCGYENKVFDSKGKLIDDDQWLLHIMMTAYNSLIHVDRYKQMFALIESFPDKPEPVYARNCTGTAGIFHVPHIAALRKSDE